MTESHDGRGDFRPLAEDSDDNSDTSARENVLSSRTFSREAQRETQEVVVLEDTEVSDSERADASAEEEADAPIEPEEAPSAPSKPPRKRMRSDADTLKAFPVVTKPEPTECTICYDSCTISGRHRLVSLKCGHLFGKKCVERWVQVRSLSHAHCVVS